MGVPSSDPSSKFLPLTLYCMAYSLKEFRVLPLSPKVLKASKYLSLRFLLPTYLSASPGKPLPLSWLLFHSFGSPSTECGEGNGTPLQYPCLENPTDRGAWWAAVHGVAGSWTRLSDFTFTFHFHALEKEMATHSSVLVWRIPGMGEPGGLQSMGSHRVGHNWSDLAAAAAAQNGYLNICCVMN